MRAACLAVVVLAVSAAPARAWEEAPFRALPGHAEVNCLGATGDEGGLASYTPFGTKSTALLAAGRGGVSASGRARLGELVTCPVVRGQGGAAVALGADVGSLNGVRMHAAIRDAGGAFGPATDLGPSDLIEGTYDAAITASGHAVAAWVQARGDDGRSPLRVVAARRAPGGAFGPPEPLTPWRSAGVRGSIGVVADIDRTGAASVAWKLQGRGRSYHVAVASAAPGAAFGTPQVLTRRADPGADLALAVAPDGGALLVHDGPGTQALRLYERAAGAGGFGPARTLPSTERDGTTLGPALAVGDGGAAVAAWLDGTDERIHAVTRPAGGSFGPARVVAPAAGAGVRAPTEPDFDPALSAALSSGGRAVLAWMASRRLPDAPRAALAASGTLAGGFGPAAVLGGPVRSTSAVEALTLADGEPAVAWADEVTLGFGFSGSVHEVGERDGRVHVAHADGTGGPPAPPPRARLRARRVQRLQPDQGVRLRVRCSAACDVRAYIRKPHGVVSRGASLPAAGARDVVIRPAIGALAPRRPGTVVAHVRVSAPGSSAARTLRLPLRLIRRPLPPVPRIVGARAVRHGRTIALTWRTSFPARGVTFLFSPDELDPPLVEGAGRSRFSLRLRSPRGRRVRRIVIRAVDRVGEHGTERIVPVH